VARDITEQVRVNERLGRLTLNSDNRTKIWPVRTRTWSVSLSSRATICGPLRMISVLRSYSLGIPGRRRRRCGNLYREHGRGAKRMRELLADLLTYTEVVANRSAHRDGRS
jgi:hypothetical protein